MAYCIAQRVDLFGLSGHRAFGWELITFPDATDEKQAPVMLAGDRTYIRTPAQMEITNGWVFLQSAREPTK